MVDMVRIEHKDAGLQAEVVDEAVEAWTEHGWTVVEDEGSGEPTTASQAAPNGPAAPDTF